MLKRFQGTHDVCVHRAGHVRGAYGTRDAGHVFRYARVRHWMDFTRCSKLRLMTAK